MPDFPTAGNPPFINRALTLAEWRDYVANYQFGKIKPTMVVLHHTYRPDEKQWKGLASMRGMQNFYAQLGWTSAPHFYVANDGIWLATPMSQIGIHAGTGNGSIRAGWYSLGLEMVGYFDTVRPSGQMWELSKAVMGELSKKLGIPPRKLITFHRDYTNKKSCPGWAVTKEWVWGEVEAYTKNVAPPAPPPIGPIGHPPPSEELLLESLLNESFGKKGQSYNPNMAFHQAAVDRALGMPMAKGGTLNVDGKQYQFQPFAKDTVFCEVPNWGDVQVLSELLGGSIPPSGLGRALLDATYQAGGSAFRPDWAFHQYAVASKLGTPVGKSANITVDGKQYSYQAFALDTVYNLVPNWTDIKRVSELAAATDPAQVRLRDALLTETYKQAGTTYHADWAFHQLARKYSIGAPLADSYQTKIGEVTYALQVYALDTLYNVVPKWSEVKRLKDLAAGQGMPALGGSGDDMLGGDGMLGGEPAVEEGADVTIDGSWEPPTDVSYRVISHTPQSPAFSSREGRGVEFVVLHGVAGAPADVLEQMTSFSARFSAHYYVGYDGSITRLVDEQYAAWHAGFATAEGLWFNLNRRSVGIVLERPAGWPDVAAENSDEQIFALRWLLADLDRRHRLNPDSIILWSSFAGSDEASLDGLPLDVLREALAG